MSEKIYFTMPFRAEKLIKRGELERSDLQQSVKQNMRLLLITPPLRVRFDPYYGCLVHWQQFLASNRAMEHKREEDNFKVKMETNIRNLIEKYEIRVALRDVSVTIKYKKEDYFPWLISADQRVQNDVLQMVVKIAGSIKPEYAYGETLELEDTIPLL
jgi:phage baseplate assembly protein W